VKIDCVNFTAKKDERDIGDIGILIMKSNYTKFLGLTTECTLTWERHIEEINKKLSSASYIIRNIKPIMSIITLKNIYYSCFNSVMTHGLIYSGNLPHADKIFKMQKRVIRLMKGCGYTESCRELFKEMKILPLKSQYVYSLMMFLIRNRDKFVINKDYHEVNTTQNINLHMYQVTLAKYGKGEYHMAVKVFNGLPYKLKVISNDAREFKVKLKDFLYLNSFYILEEFFNS
jgi:hypothetical protein